MYTICSQLAMPTRVLILRRFPFHVHFPFSITRFGEHTKHASPNTHPFLGTKVATLTCGRSPQPKKHYPPAGPPHPPKSEGPPQLKPTIAMKSRAAPQPAPIRKPQAPRKYWACPSEGRACQRPLPVRHYPSSVSFTVAASCFSENGFGKKVKLSPSCKFLSNASSA